MFVVVTRTGGFAGLQRTWEVRVDEQPDPEEWYLLIAAVPWEATDESAASAESAASNPPAPAEASARGADRYVYDIECPPHEAQVPETELTGPWRDLVKRVTEAGEVRRPR